MWTRPASEEVSGWRNADTNRRRAAGGRRRAEEGGDREDRRIVLRLELAGGQYRSAGCPALGFRIARPSLDKSDKSAGPPPGQLTRKVHLYPALLQRVSISRLHRLCIPPPTLLSSPPFSCKLLLYLSSLLTSPPSPLPSVIAPPPLLSFSFSPSSSSSSSFPTSIPSSRPSPDPRHP
eukprot:9493239-Pyramimonas_sp.AAC.1